MSRLEMEPCDGADTGHQQKQLPPPVAAFEQDGEVADLLRDLVRDDGQRRCNAQRDGDEEGSRDDGTRDVRICSGNSSINAAPPTAPMLPSALNARIQGNIRDPHAVAAAMGTRGFWGRFLRSRPSEGAV